MTPEDKLRDFIVNELSYAGDPKALTDAYGLIENNVIDSLGIFQIVRFLESEFDVEVLDEELLPENFGTIGDLARLVYNKQAVG